MSGPRYAHLASQMLLQVESVPPPPPDADDRARAIATVARSISATHLRRRVRQWAAASIAAAAVAITGFTGYRLTTRGASAAFTPAAGSPVTQIVAHPVVNASSSAVVSGAQATLDDGRLLGPGSHVVTPATGRATLSFSTGSTVLLRGSTAITVAVEGTMQRLRLEAGTVDLHVEKLAPGQRFIIDTPDSEVEVRGTRFSVSVVAPDEDCGGWARTRVAVTEGIVVVRHGGTEDRVVVGEAWPGDCLRRATAFAATGLKAPRSAPPPATPSTGSTLADQNDLFAEAASAKRRGDGLTALAALDRFMGTYPVSPLAESAMVERMRILQTVAKGRASVAAKEYLARYPSGFGQVEAEAIAAQSP